MGLEEFPDPAPPLPSPSLPPRFVGCSVMLPGLVQTRFGFLRER